MDPFFFPFYSVWGNPFSSVINIFLNDVFLNVHVKCSLVSAAVMSKSIINRTEATAFLYVLSIYSRP